jgi:serine/threonine protein kinase
MQGVLEMEGGFDVILQGRIGQGFYGEVFKGILERNGQTIQQVAIKKLKTQMEANMHDFEREIMIMKVSCRFQT